MADTQASARTGPAVSEETLLLEELRRIGYSRGGCFAVYFHLSKLQAPYRKPKITRIAARSFDGLVANHSASLYILSNANLVLICRDVGIEYIDAAIFKLRALFTDDPLTSDGADTDFATWYDLSSTADYAEFEQMAITLEAESQQRSGIARPRGDETAAPIDAVALGQMERRLQSLQITDLLCQQPAVDIRSGKKGEVLFTEYFVSMADLAKRVASDIDLFASPWLFNYVTDFLDRRMLAILGRTRFKTRGESVSLNLHVATVLSPEFEIFDQQVQAGGGKVIVEFQMIDIISDMGAFGRARQWLHDRDYQVLIDGMYPLTLQYVDPGILEPDLVKIAWSPDLLEDMSAAQIEELKDMVRYLGPSKVVLSRVETQDAVRWGLNVGIHRFQGFFVDKLVEAMTAKGLI